MGRLVHFTLFAMLVCVRFVSGFNITTFFWKHPEFATFNSLLTATNVAGEINNRSSLTILALTNTLMEPFISSFDGNLPTLEVSDVLRYHVLLEYLDWQRLEQMTSGGTLVTTLYQTTGRAPSNMGAVNITTANNGQIRIGMPVPDAGFNATITGLVDKFPYTISIVRINSMLIPYGFDLSGSPAPSPFGINVTDVLVKAQNFTFLVSLMEASGVVSDFQSGQAGAGITIFAPTDDAFSALNPETLQGLTAEKKAVILKYHVLLSYYPLGSLQTIVNPVQPTLATVAMGASSYTLNITRMRGMVAVDTGIVKAPVTETVFDQKPLSIFAVPKVLLPREIFGANSPMPSPLSSPYSAPLPSPYSAPLPSVTSPTASPVHAEFSTPVDAPTISPSSPAPSVSPSIVPYSAPLSSVTSPAASPVHAEFSTPVDAPTISPSSPAPSVSPSIVPASLSPVPSISPSIVPPSLSPTPAITPSVVPSPVVSPYSSPPTPLASVTGETPSPSPSSVEVGEDTSGALATWILGREVLVCACVLVINLLVEMI
eukprot:Gb_27249 [translate_table: standard]